MVGYFSPHTNFTSLRPASLFLHIIIGLSDFTIQIFNTLLFCSSYETLRHHVDVKTSSTLPYMANRAKVYCMVV